MAINKWHEPNANMDLDVYKDWLYEFNNNDDLRDIDFGSIIPGDSDYLICHFYRGTYENLIYVAVTDGFHEDINGIEVQPQCFDGTDLFFDLQDEFRQSAIMGRGFGNFQ